MRQLMQHEAGEPQWFESELLQAPLDSNSSDMPCSATGDASGDAHYYEESKATQQPQRRSRKRSGMAMISAELMRMSDDEEEDDGALSFEDEVVNALNDADFLMETAEGELRKLASLQ